MARIVNRVFSFVSMVTTRGYGFLAPVCPVLRIGSSCAGEAVVPAAQSRRRSPGGANCAAGVVQAAQLCRRAAARLVRLAVIMWGLCRLWAA
jgi:hypothetical protein